MFVKATASVVNLPPCFGLKTGCYNRNHSSRVSRVSVRCSARTTTTTTTAGAVDSSVVNGVDLSSRVGSSLDVEKRELIGSNVVVVDEKSRLKEGKLETLWDDGYGTQSVKDYLDLAKDIIKPDGGPPRWFCPVAADGNDSPLPDSPVLLFLPGSFIFVMRIK